MPFLFTMVSPVFDQAYCPKLNFFSFVFFVFYELCIECESKVLCNEMLLRLTDDWCPIQLDFTFKGAVG